MTPKQIYQQEWYKKNSDRLLAKRVTSLCKRAKWVCYLRRRFGVTPGWYTAQMILQNGRCGICQIPSGSGKSDKDRGLAVDHDHQMKKARGLLCTRCNVGLGLVESVGLSEIQTWIDRGRENE